MKRLEVQTSSHKSRLTPSSDKGLFYLIFEMICKAGMNALTDAGSNYLIRILETSRKLMNFSGKRGCRSGSIEVRRRTEQPEYRLGDLTSVNLYLFIGERSIYAKPLHSRTECSRVDPQNCRSPLRTFDAPKCLFEDSRYMPALNLI